MTISIIHQNNKNLYLIEIQGKLELLGNDLRIGELGFLDQVPILTVGNHIIQGQRIKLKNPFLVMEKHKKQSLHCSTVIREKLIFSSRPEHVIDRTSLI